MRGHPPHFLTVPLADCVVQIYFRYTKLAHCNCFPGESPHVLEA